MFFKIRGVNFILWRQDDKILIQKRSEDALVFPGEYCIPGGGVNFGESPDEAVIREIEEEIGLKIKYFNFMCGFEYTLNDEKKYNFFYIIKVDNPTVKSNEGEMIWLSIPEVKKLKLAHHENELLKLIESYIC